MVNSVMAYKVKLGFNCPICSGSGKKKDCIGIGNSVNCRQNREPLDDRWQPSIRNGQHTLTSSHFWVYVPKRNSIAEFDKEAWLKQKEKINSQRLDEVKRELSHLKLAERDLEAKKMLSGMDLAISDRKKLKDRGLTDEQIDRRGFKSIREHQLISQDVSNNLPGVAVDYNGQKYLSTSVKDGFLVPIWNDFTGEIRGFQPRDNDPNTPNKYQWLRSKFSPKVLIKDSVELPIAVIIPEIPVKRPQLNFCEGTLKPIPAAERTGNIFVGASGGNFSSSPNQVREALIFYEEYIQQFLTSQRAEMYFYTNGKLNAYLNVDAGDAVNLSVIARLQNQVKFLESLNLHVSIVWWGQFTKQSSHDCDELTVIDRRQIRYLTPAQFFSLAEHKRQLIVRRKFTPDIVYNQEFLPYIDYQDNHIYAVKSPLGTGKTSRLSEWLVNNEEWLQYNQIFLFSLRNTLVEQTVANLNNALALASSQKFQMVKEKDFIDIDYDLWLANCIDSLEKYQLEKVYEPILVLDEIISLLGHAYFANTHISHNRVLILERFWDIIRKARLVICLDANLADWAMEMFKKKCPNKPILKVENQYKPVKKHPCKILLGTHIDFKEGSKLYKNDKRPMIIDIEKLANTNLPFSVASDSQKQGESLHILLKSMGKKGFILDSKTSGSKTAKVFLANPNEFILKHKLDYLIYSPSAESGLDISIKGYFKAHFAFLFGTTDVNPLDALSQIIKRVRDDIPLYVWVGNRAVSLIDKHINKDSLAMFKAGLDSNFLERLEIITEGNDDPLIQKQLLQQYRSAKNLDYELATDMLYYATIEKENLREWFIDYLIGLGLPVELYSVEKDSMDITNIGEDFLLARDTRNQNDATDIFNATEPVLVDGRWETEVTEDLEGFWSSKVKAAIYNKLPFIETFKCWGVDLINLIRNKNPHLIPLLELEIKVRNLALALNAYSVPYKRLLKGDYKNWWNQRDDLPIVKEIASLPLLELIDRGGEFTMNDPLVLKLLGNCSNGKIRKTLGLPRGALSNSSLLRHLVGLFGYKLTSSRKRIGKDERITVYKIESIIDNTLRTQLQQSLLVKLEGKGRKGEQMPWEYPVVLQENAASNIPLKNDSIEVNQMVIESQLEGDRKDLIFLKEKENNWTDNVLNETSQEIQSIKIEPIRSEMITERQLEGDQKDLILSKEKENNWADNVLNETYQEIQSIKIEPIVEVLSIESQVAKVTEVLFLINHTTRTDHRAFEWIVKDFGCAIVGKALSFLKDVNQRLTLYQWLREAQTGLKIGCEVIFSGVRHTLLRFSDFNQVVLKICGTNQEFEVDLSHFLKPS